jgi:hypothetical protein
MKSNYLVNEIRRSLGDHPQGVSPFGIRPQGGPVSLGQIPRSELTVPVRDSGPDAWGYRVPLPPGSKYMWNNDGVWHMSDREQETGLWLTDVGSRLDVIFTQEGRPMWLSYRAGEYR